MNLHRAFILLLAGAVTLFACKKPTLDDTKLLPNDELALRFTDTLTVAAESVREDSIVVTSATLCLLGSMHDPELGYTNAGCYIPFLLKNTNLTFGDSAVTLDSVTLTLWYFSTYGDWRTPQTVEVFEMSEDVLDSVAYASDKVFSVYQNPVGTKTFIPRTKDSLTVAGEKIPPSLRIKLSNSFGQKFIDASGTSSYANDASFKAFFKGLYISASKAGGGQGAVAFNPYQEGVRITLYYHDANDSVSSYAFPADAPLVVNQYAHDYRNSTLNNAGDSLLFLQGLAGQNIKLTVPHIRNLGNILINKAELVVTVLPATLGNDTLFPPPALLTVLMSDEDGNFKGATPDQVFPSAIFGGTKIEETDTVSGEKLIRYKFSLSRYYQEVVSEIREDHGIFILPDKRYQTPNRLVAGGTGHSKYAIKLNLVYDVIN